MRRISHIIVILTIIWIDLLIIGLILSACCVQSPRQAFQDTRAVFENVTEGIGQQFGRLMTEQSIGTRYLRMLPKVSVSSYLDETEIRPTLLSTVAKTDYQIDWWNVSGNSVENIVSKQIRTLPDPATTDAGGDIQKPFVSQNMRFGVVQTLKLRT